MITDFYILMAAPIEKPVALILFTNYNGQKGSYRGNIK
jgi:hypothetical protein